MPRTTERKHSVISNYDILVIKMNKYLIPSILAVTIILAVAASAIFLTGHTVSAQSSPGLTQFTALSHATSDQYASMIGADMFSGMMNGGYSSMMGGGGTGMIGADMFSGMMNGGYSSMMGGGGTGEFGTHV
ncbi:MAG: hypothetical protein QXE05_11925, partial [Nitrososphaeria archaeon]